MGPPFYLNKEELNKCVYVFCWSAHDQMNRKPTDENVEWDWGSHELVNYGDTKDATAS